MRLVFTKIGNGINFAWVSFDNGITYKKYSKSTMLGSIQFDIKDCKDLDYIIIKIGDTIYRPIYNSSRRTCFLNKIKNTEVDNNVSTNKLSKYTFKTKYDSKLKSLVIYLNITDAAYNDINKINAFFDKILYKIPIRISLKDHTKAIATYDKNGYYYISSSKSKNRRRKMIFNLESTFFGDNKLVINDNKIVMGL